MKPYLTCVLTIPFFLYFLSSNAQVKLEIEGIGSYPAYLAQFGLNSPCDIDTIRSQIRLINDNTSDRLGCLPYTDSKITGNIAVINLSPLRECTFEEKALRAQENGAIAVVICNEGNYLRPLPGTSDSITIPTLLIWDYFCHQFLLEYDSSEIFMAKIFSNLPEYNSDNEILWGSGPQQGQFENGLSPWTIQNCFIDVHDSIVRDEVTWEWNPNIIERFYGAQLSSYSRCNGGMGYDATLWNIEYLNEKGDISNPETYPDHHCELLSPIIDLSDAESVYLQFWQINFSLYGNDDPSDPATIIYVSKDGGKTFYRKIEVPSELFILDHSDDFGISELMDFHMPELAGEDSVRIRLDFHGDFYAWYIDDIYFTESITSNNINIFNSIPSSNLIYPNPSRNNIYIDTDRINISNLSCIEIYSFEGKLMKKQSRDFSSILTNELNPGIYLVKLVDKNGASRVQKLIKE